MYQLCQYILYNRAEVQNDILRIPILTSGKYTDLYTYVVLTF